MLVAAAVSWVAVLGGAIGAQSLAWSPASHLVPAAAAAEAHAPAPRGSVRQVEPADVIARDGARLRVTYLERYGNGRAWLEVSDGSAYRVRGGVRPCAAEDSAGPCVWDARHRGNGRGRSFMVLPGERVAYLSHRGAHELAGDYRRAGR
jgi:hypothetical protein